MVVCLTCLSPAFSSEVLVETNINITLFRLAVMRVLQSIHSAGVQHNDVAEWNVLFHNGRLWMIDFASATEHDCKRTFNIEHVRPFATDEEHGCLELNTAASEHLSLLSADYYEYNNLTPPTEEEFLAGIGDGVQKWKQVAQGDSNSWGTPVWVTLSCTAFTPAARCSQIISGPDCRVVRQGTQYVCSGAETG